MADAPKRITFTASLPPIQSAISLDGYGDGARIKLDIPRTDAEAVLLLQHYGAGRDLRVTIEFDVTETERGQKRTQNGTKRTEAV